MSTRHDWDRRTEELLGTGDLAELAPGPVELDRAFTERTLAAILAEDHPSPRRLRGSRTLAAVTVAVLASGGVAVAAGGAPDFVSRGVTELAGRGGAQAPPVSLYADVAVPGGGRFAAWHGASADRECVAEAHNWNGHEGAGGYGMSCGRAAPSGPDRDARTFGQTFSPDAARTTYYPVVYGRVSEQTVSSVRVHGRLFGGGSYVREAVLDPATRGFGVVVPGARATSSLQREWSTPSGEVEAWDSRLRSVLVDLLDEQGGVVRTVTVLDVDLSALRPGLRSYDDLGR